MAKKKNNGAPLKRGALQDEEKRKIEQLIKFEGYTAVARIINRDPQTVRKYCQRQGITLDKASRQKGALYKMEQSVHFNELKQIMTEEEIKVAHRTYLDLMKQFGSDVLPSEEFQVIDYCTVQCLLSRALLREKRLNEEMIVQNKLRAELEKEKARIDKEDEFDDEARDSWLDKVEQVELRMGNIMDELKTIRKDQTTLLERKEKATAAMHGSRTQRANQLNKANENWGDYVVQLQKNQEFRKQCGLDIEKFRLGIREEYIRLASVKHTYVNGEDDYPILNNNTLEGDPAHGV